MASHQHLRHVMSIIGIANILNQIDRKCIKREFATGPCQKKDVMLVNFFGPDLRNR